MKFTCVSRSVATLSAVAALTVGAAPAFAQTLEESAPETPATNDALPIVHTYRGSDHLLSLIHI